MPLPLDHAATLLDCLEHYTRLQPEARAYTFIANGERDDRVLSYAELDRRSRQLAGHLAATGCSGQAVLLLFPSGLEFIVAFFACLHAGAIAVPANLARNPQHFARLRLIIQDSGTRRVLTTAGLKASVGTGLQAAGVDAAVRVEAEEDAAGAPAWERGADAVEASSLAFLQYTSGSTGAPKGVMVTHAQLVANERAIQRSVAMPEFVECAGWLPQFHDMGLIGTTLQPIALGGHYAFMSPLHFIQRPLRWLQALSRFRAQTSAAPNFALRMCLKAAEGQDVALDLSALRSVFCGAEPVNAETVQRFRARFAAAGLAAGVVRPCYGLAEATLIVSGAVAPDASSVLRLDRDALTRDQAQPSAGEGGQDCVCCGAAVPQHEVAIVDADGNALPAGAVGEIWVRGPSVAQGYWNNPEATEKTFAARTADGRGPYLRTGDLGFVQGGGVYVTGRAKELMIVRGRNYYPNDIEQTLSRAVEADADGPCAVFSLEMDGEEKVVALLELPRRRAAVAQEDAARILAAARHAVTQAHELQLADILLLRHGAIPRTSSGKTQRLACARLYRDGELQALMAEVLAPDLAADASPQPAPALS
ncbi:fatty acyl-AMP ligase [Azohydromonas australica]|uniref:fatty acyl-AMP ligase n=1 Tax=Azohydromonas australica TaxID=364039 RepID=UPI0003F78FA0|nr:fatty acyl-AMP ligase [Azohydromonas australica]